MGSDLICLNLLSKNTKLRWNWKYIYIFFCDCWHKYTLFLINTHDILFLVKKMCVCACMQSVSQLVTTGVRQLRTGSHACSSATSAATNACVYLQALTGTKKNVHATTNGRQRKENLNVLRISGCLLRETKLCTRK